MAEVSTKPYLIRAIYEWCADSGFTPHVAVAVDGSVRVPAEFVKNGEIVLNVSALATSRLAMDNTAISFQARFGGVAREVYVPIERVIAIYARENGQGMAFPLPAPAPARGTPAGPAAAGPAAALRLAGAPGPAAADAAPPGEPGEVTGAPDAPEPPGPAPEGPAPSRRPSLTRIK